jgi:uncharacterized protein
VPTTDGDRVHAVLDDVECRMLLGAAVIGRLAYTECALPAVRAVSFAVRDGEVLIPAHAGSTLVTAVRGAVVAFQTDSFDDARTGWSVTVVGPSRVVSDPALLAALVRFGSPAGAGAAERCVIAVRLDLVRGVRTTLPAGPASQG